MAEFLLLLYLPVASLERVSKENVLSWLKNIAS